MIGVRILRVVHRLYPPTIGGSAYYAHLLSAHQARMGHHVVVLTAREGDYPSHEFRDGYEIFRYRSVASPWGNPITPAMLAKLLSYDDDAFDIIDAHSHLMFTTALAAVKKQFSRKPFIVINHGFMVRRGPFLESLQDLYLSSIGKWTLTSADYVVSLTESERRRSISAGVNPGKAIVIPNGVDIELFRPMACDPIPHSIIWIGRYVTEKGLTHLLRAASIVVHEFPDSKFILVGYGEELPKLLELARSLRLEDRVVFLDPRPQQEIAVLLNRCTLFVLPSLTEGFPSALLEAMACAKPVVVTSGIGLEEVVSDGGILVPPADPNALADSISRILRAEEFAKTLGLRARERVVAQYRWQNVVYAVNELFKRAIEEKGD